MEQHTNNLNGTTELHHIRTLHLFAGAGGGLLADLLLGHRPVCAVEIDQHCQQVLSQRQKDSVLPWFPIFEDVTTFDGRPWRGLVEAVCGGYPCQGFSNAASGKNKPEKDLSHEFVRVVSEVLPDHVFGENVSREAVESVCEDLRDLGYNARFGQVTAKDMGADHYRPRWWLRAYSDLHGKLRIQINAKVAELPKLRCNIWASFPNEFRVAHGVADRMERIRAIGNGQVPIVAATAWNLLKP